MERACRETVLSPLVTTPPLPVALNSSVMVEGDGAWNAQGPRVAEKPDIVDSSQNIVQKIFEFFFKMSRQKVNIRLDCFISIFIHLKLFLVKKKTKPSFVVLFACINLVYTIYTHHYF